ncbi:hypothetical protein [Flaviaesturariibacter aridisoli]|uniref:Uncharacterized protein n=1 Tax=Flaviaesturariibacter aridisoli TaxID=2545761 RepID=A0A4R4E3H4_9BACT|nr:hypothetical protein [Flaviaesturariibacter aridisoli]TCZ74094.1 hypothetical protein E0486_03190 [Flaviaesturariibacter aridisoli]
MRPEREQPKDPMLDVPAEANRQKHINFLDDDERPDSSDREERARDQERRRQWEEGLRAGRESSNDE